VEAGDSREVDELMEEDNAFEADVVTGVEDAGNADEKEIVPMRLRRTMFLKNI